LIVLPLLASVQAQDLLTAIGKYPQLSMFGSLLQNRSNLIIPASGSDKVTILVPDNAAFSIYEKNAGKPLSALNDTVLKDLIQYHTLTRDLTGSDLKQPGGVVVETQLTDSAYNIRNQQNGATPGQVVFVSQANGASKLVVRAPAPVTETVQSGTGALVTLEIVDGVWDGGRLQIIDSFLTLPISCSATFDVRGLTALQTSLTRTNLTDTLNSIPDVVCLAPNNAAFAHAGNPNTDADVNTLSDALKFHTIPGPGYTTLLKNGQILTSVNNQKILVTEASDGSLYFNDAKVLNSNVIVNNGVVHVLEKVMSAYGSFDPKKLGAASATTSGTGTQPSPTNGSPTVMVKGSALGLVLAMAFVVQSFV